MLIYLASVSLLSCVNTALIRTKNEVEHIYHKNRQARQVCLDRVDPRTGVSDCPSKAALCTNPLYQQLMWEQCPLTCGRCPAVLPNSGGITPVVPGQSSCFDKLPVLTSLGATCVDRVDPRTGVADCPSKAALCANPVYQQIMWEQCPLTCGRCPAVLPNSGGVTPVVPGATCVDRVDPRTGVSDCPSRAALCANPLYQKLLWEQCPLTCGRCPAVLPNSGGVTPVVPGATCFDRVDPRTGVSDCPSKAALCANPLYQKLLWEQCPLTCNRCPGIL